MIIKTQLADVFKGTYVCAYVYVYVYIHAQGSKTVSLEWII